MVDLEKTEKNAKISLKWIKKTIDFIQKRRKIIGLLFISFVILIVFISLAFYKGWIKIDLNENTDLKIINATQTFYFYNTELKPNKIYEIELTITSNEKIKTLSSIYTIPLQPANSLPILSNYSGECDFFEKDSCTIKTTLNTSGIKEGDYKFCVLTIDKRNNDRSLNYCYPSMRSIG